MEELMDVLQDRDLQLWQSLVSIKYSAEYI